MQANRVAHQTRVRAGEIPVQRPVIRRRADRYHRLDPGRARPVEHARQRASAGEGFEMSVRVDQAHGRYRSPSSGSFSFLFISLFLFFFPDRSRERGKIKSKEKEQESVTCSHSME
jgi:hypothetical protein